MRSLRAKLKAFRRDAGFKSDERIKALCQVCKQPMLVASGQEAYYHGACRRLRE